MDPAVAGQVELQRVARDVRPRLRRHGTSHLGVAALLALCSSLLQRSLKGGLVAVGSLNLGGSVDPVYNPVDVAELAIEKGARILLMPVSARRQLIDLPDDRATKVDIQFYGDAREALIKGLAE